MRRAAEGVKFGPAPPQSGPRRAAGAADGDPGWPAYRTDQRLTRLLDTDPRTAPYPEEPPGGSGTDPISIHSTCSDGLPCLFSARVEVADSGARDELG
jgi:hypothetical protein